MSDLMSILQLFAFALIGVSILGLVASFSPTLYIAQAALASKSKSFKSSSYWLMGGVTLAIILLLILFQSFNLTSLLNAINSTIHALFISVIVNILIGILFILVGVRYIHTRHSHQSYEADAETVHKAGGASALFGFGFAKTFLSISGASAVYIAGNLIAGISGTIIDRALLTSVFLAASLAPFLITLMVIERNPGKVQIGITFIRNHLKQMNYRLTVGVAAVIFGTAILIINIMMALFY